MATKNIVMQNFAKPCGFVGNLIGEYMARDNYHLNLWSVQTLNIQETDNILEVGYGPGIAIQEIAKLASEGYVAGIDYSELMHHQAKKRNANAVKEGRIDLRVGNVSELPAFKQQFDKILAVNNIMYWENPVKSLWDLRQNLKSGGFIAVVLQRNEETLQQGQCNDEINWYVNCLRQAGYSNVQVAAQPVEKPSVKTRKNLLFQFVECGMAFAYNQQYVSPEESKAVAGICIIGFNPTIEHILMEYHAYQASQRSFERSRTIFIQNPRPRCLKEEDEPTFLESLL